MRVINLIDDVNLGGVTRGVAGLAHGLSPSIDVQLLAVRTSWRLAPMLNADVAVIDFTLSWAKLAFLVSLRCRFRGPVVIVEHSYTRAFEQQCVNSRRRFRFFLRLCFRLAHKVVAVSEGQADWMIDAGLVKVERLVCIPQAIDIEYLADQPLTQRQSGPLRLGAYGRFVKQKGFDTLLKAMRSISPEIATLDLAGYGPEGAALKALAGDLPHVRVHGLATNLPSFLKQIDCVIVPSRWEAYGLVAHEARAAGKPLIATSVDGLVEQLRSGCGLLTPPNDQAGLAESIRTMAGLDLEAMAVAARLSTTGCLHRKLEAWRQLFTAAVAVA